VTGDRGRNERLARPGPYQRDARLTRAPSRSMQVQRRAATTRADPALPVMPTCIWTCEAVLQDVPVFGNTLQFDRRQRQADYRASRVEQGRAGYCRPSGAARRCARPRMAALYGVIAMETGAAPTLIALPAVLVPVPTGVTVPEPLLTT